MNANIESEEVERSFAGKGSKEIRWYLEGNVNIKTVFVKLWIYIYKNDLLEWNKNSMQGRDKRE